MNNEVHFYTVTLFQKCHSSLFKILLCKDFNMKFETKRNYYHFVINMLWGHKIYKEKYQPLHNKHLFCKKICYPTSTCVPKLVFTIEIGHTYNANKMSLYNYNYLLSRLTSTIVPIMVCAFFMEISNKNKILKQKCHHTL